jgi:hypothetical protein
MRCRKERTLRLHCSLSPYDAADTDVVVVGPLIGVAIVAAAGAMAERFSSDAPNRGAPIVPQLFGARFPGINSLNY